MTLRKLFSAVVAAFFGCVVAGVGAGLLGLPEAGFALFMGIGAAIGGWLGWKFPSRPRARRRYGDEGEGGGPKGPTPLERAKEKAGVIDPLNR